MKARQHFGEEIESCFVFSKKLAVVTFLNKFLDLTNIKEALEGILYKNWPPLEVEVVDINGLYQARIKSKAHEISKCTLSL